MMTSMYLTPVHAEHLHLNTSGHIKPAPLKQGHHLSELRLQTPSVGNGGDEAIASNGGFGENGLGNKLMKNESICIKPLILQNAPNKKDLTQLGLALMPGQNVVGYEAVKVPKSRVTNGSRFGSTSTIGNPAPKIVINLST